MLLMSREAEKHTVHFPQLGSISIQRPRESGNRNLCMPTEAIEVAPIFAVAADLIYVVVWAFKQLVIHWEKSNYISKIINSFSQKLK